MTPRIARCRSHPGPVAPGVFEFAFDRVESSMTAAPPRSSPPRLASCAAAAGARIGMRTCVRRSTVRDVARLAAQPPRRVGGRGVLRKRGFVCPVRSSKGLLSGRPAGLGGHRSGRPAYWEGTHSCRGRARPPEGAARPVQGAVARKQGSDSSHGDTRAATRASARYAQACRFAHAERAT